ncbi:MAG: lipocalin family protein [Pseudomonadota bacterium]
MRGMIKWCWALPIVIASMNAQAAPQVAPLPVPLVEKVDLPRFMGSWYVIAQITADSDRDAFNAVETYSINPDGSIGTVYRNRQGSFDGPEKVMTPVGYVTEGTGNALWGVRLYWWLPFKLEYRISYLAPDHSVTIIARSKRDYVWIMSRRPDMSAADLARYTALIGSWGYDTSKLLQVPQRWPEP